MGALVLHFGMQKTGGTSIQLSLKNAATDDGFAYLSLGKTNSSAGLMAGFASHPGNYPLFAKAGYSEEKLKQQRAAMRRQLTEQLSGMGDKTTIISAEDILLMDAAGLAELRDFLSPMASGILLAGYIRAPKGYIESGFQQRVKSGNAEFKITRHLYPGYRPLFEALENTFGTDKVQFWPFKPNHFPNRCVVQDFCRRIGIQLPPDKIIDINDELSLPAIRLLYAYRKYGPGFQKIAVDNPLRGDANAEAVRENQRLVEQLLQLAGPKLHIDNRLIHPILRKQREDIEWMEARLGAPLKDPQAPAGEPVIAAEADLLQFEAPELEWLAEQVGWAASRFKSAEPRHELVAEAVHALRMKLAEHQLAETAQKQQSAPQPRAAKAEKPPKGPFILHIGMQKTGSTSIQLSLKNTAPDERFTYLTLGKKAKASPGVIAGFATRPSDYHLFTKVNWPEEKMDKHRKAMRRQLHRSLKQCGGKTAILSGEDIPLMDEAGLVELRDFLSKRTTDIKVVGYIREPKGYMESSFQQRLKNGKGALNMEGLYPRYQRLFEGFEKAFGADNVQYWLFNTADFPNRCVVQDFCRRIGMDFPADKVITANIALTLPAIRLLYAYRKFGSGYGIGPWMIRENQLLIDQLTKLDGPKLRFDDSMVEPVLNKYREDIQWMETRIGKPFKPQPVPAENIDNAVERQQRSEPTISKETDLLQFEAPELEWLAEQVDWETSRFKPKWQRHELVAEAVHALRLKLADLHLPKTASQEQREAARNRGGKFSKLWQKDVKELVSEAKSARPTYFEKMSNARARALVKIVFRKVNRQLNRPGCVQLQIPGFGKFTTVPVSYEMDGELITSRQIEFSPEKALKSPQKKPNKNDELINRKL